MEQVQNIVSGIQDIVEELDQLDEEKDTMKIQMEYAITLGQHKKMSYL
jgi:hypothetical protein